MDKEKMQLMTRDFERVGAESFREEYALIEFIDNNAKSDLIDFFANYDNEDWVANINPRLLLDESTDYLGILEKVLNEAGKHEQAEYFSIDNIFSRNEDLFKPNLYMIDTYNLEDYITQILNGDTEVLQRLKQEIIEAGVEKDTIDALRRTEFKYYAEAHGVDLNKKSTRKDIVDVFMKAPCTFSFCCDDGFLDFNISAKDFIKALIEKERSRGEER